MTENGDVSVPPQENRKPRDSVAGVDLGKSRDPLTPIQDALKVKGIDVNRATIPRIRSGDTAGTKIDQQGEAREVLNSGDASKKDQIYLEIAKKAVEMRIPKDSSVGGEFVSTGFTEGLATSLQIDHKVLQRMIRGMRVDMVYAHRTGASSEFLGKFQETAESFIKAYTRRGVHVRPETKRKLEEIDSEWSGDIEEFYRLMYEKLGTRAIGSWAPYEMEAFSEFYTSRIVSGSPLTLFDKLVLGVKNKQGRIGNLSEEIRGSSGIRTDQSVIELHGDMLVYGKSKFEPNLATT